MNEHMLTREELFDSLEKDGIKVDDSVLTKAMNGNGPALFHIGYEYQNTMKEYTKAIAWYYLSAKRNYCSAQNNIGHLYSEGRGVPIDFDIAMEWFLKAAKQNNKTAYKNIGLSFEKGEGVPIDKYKALEWYHKYSIASETITRLNTEGYILTSLDTVKSLDLLVMETNKIIDMKKRKDIQDMEERVHLLQDTVSLLNADLQGKSSCIASLNTKIDELVTKNSEDQHEDKEKIELLSDGNQSLQQLLNQSSDEINALKKVNKQLEEEIDNLKANSRPEEESRSVDACDNSSMMEDRFNQLDQKISNLNNNFVQLLINTNISHKRDSGRRFNTVASKKKSIQKASFLF